MCTYMHDYIYISTCSECMFRYTLHVLIACLVFAFGVIVVLGTLDADETGGFDQLFYRCGMMWA